MGFSVSGVASDEDQDIAGLANDLAGLEWPRSDTTNNSASVTGSARLLADLSSRTDCSDTLSERYASLELAKDINVATLDYDGKVAELKTIFADLSEIDMRMALKKSNGDFSKACEELLNIQYLEENGLRPKGIEGAFIPDGMVGYKSQCIHKVLPLSFLLIDRVGRSETPKDKGKNRLDISYSLAPPDLSEDDTTITVPASVSLRAPARGNSLPRIATTGSPVPKAIHSAPASARMSPSGWQTIEAKQKIYNERSAEASAAYDSAAESFRAAQQAYRRGGSDKYFRPVASVLAERAREQLEAAKAADVHKYYALVDKSSTAGSIDLHGVPVAEGVRIALERTQLWWSGLGEDRAKKAREEGFTVITGLGKHSANGVSRLRQEVGAALKRDGWRVRLETGQFVVTGRT